MKRILAVTYLQSINCSALTEDLTDDAEADEDDFNIRSQEELASMMNSTTDLMTVLLACIAGISLVVGGIGIMNIMYVSVTERTREIGLRMSVGARGVDILAQFLIETVMLSVTGGIIGVLAGVGAAYGVNLPLPFLMLTVGIGEVLSCTILGLIVYYALNRYRNTLFPRAAAM